MALGDKMPSYPQWDVLKRVLATAKSEEKGVQVVSANGTLAEISKIQFWRESYGNFAVHENHDRVILFHASDILFVDNSGQSLVLRLKVGKDARNA